MSALDLASIGPGFADPVLDSQAAFRRALAALSRPASIVGCGEELRPPAGLHRAAYALALALLDRDCRLWLGAPVPEAVAQLRFHTGCILATRPDDAHFALIPSPRQMPPLESFARGSDETPDRSATLILQVEALDADGPWRLSGPGIRGPARLGVAGLDGRFVAQWARNGARFPRGVDLFLACGGRLCGLPRTTRIEP